MERLALSHCATLTFLDDGKVEQATLEYRKEYLGTIKKLYSEAAKTYPVRFSKAEHWCVWTKDLYILSRKIEEALKENDSEKALKLLEQARGHFHSLHKETETLHCNDLIYEFRAEAAKEKPSPEKLQNIVKKLDAAEPSCIAKSKADEYSEAKDVWKKAIEPLISDDQIDPSQHDSLKKASETFYRSFGIQYE